MSDKERRIKDEMKAILASTTKSRQPELSERWVPAFGFEGLYEVSSYGRVRRSSEAIGTKVGKILRPSKIRPKVWLRKDGKAHMRQVHLLVIHSFDGKPSDLTLECRHLDGDDSNSRLDNLMFGTHRENESDKFIHGTLPVGERHYRARWVDDDIRWMRALTDLGVPQKMVARMFDTTQGTVSKIHLRKRWEHVEDYLP